MYARLWWKDARQFWPIWVILATAAAIVQALLLYYLGQEARHGALGFSALTCTILYAFATGAAAFAGEAEVGTLRLLDIMPVDRWVVWTSKVSFALVTTLALMLVLVTMAMVSTDSWSAPGSTVLGIALAYGMIVLVGLGWGLFWSSILSNALNAAVTAICSTAVSVTLILYQIDNVYPNRNDPFVFALWQLFLFLATLIASVMIFVRAVGWKRLQLEFRSPIVVHLPESTNPRRAQIQLQTPVASVLMRRPVVIHEATVTAQPPRRSWVVEARAVAWQTMKEGRKTVCLLAITGLVATGLVVPAWRNNPSFETLLLTSIGISLVAGASVFGLENRARTNRFLTHHGARPGLVWLVKLLVWVVESCVVSALAIVLALAVIWASVAVFGNSFLSQGGGMSTESELSGLFMIPLCFGVALVCGMAIRRSLTAVVIALVMSLLLTFPLIALVITHMLPVQGLLVIPVGLLFVSWAWSGDWMLDRPAPGRWVRLGLLLAGFFTVAVSWYAGYRAWGIRDVGLVPLPNAWVRASAEALPADQNAAELYRQAGNRLVGPITDSSESLDRNRQVLDLIRQGGARSNCRFKNRGTQTLIGLPILPPMTQLAALVTLDASELQTHDNLNGAWNDIMLLFRMARHIGEEPALYQALTMIALERSATAAAMAWSGAPGQTPERLRAALTACRNLQELPSPAEVVQTEANLVENTLDLPASEIRNWLYESMYGAARSERAPTFALVDMIMTPWERVRIRRVNRLVSKATIQDVMREPWQRSKSANTEIDHAQSTTRLAMMLIPNTNAYIGANDRVDVARRALVQMLAIRAWQLRHGGRFPESLADLVPDELSALPTDPYSGKPFGYVHSNGQILPPLGLAVGNSQVHAAAPGSWLLYSVGPDGHDNGGSTSIHHDGWEKATQPVDIIFEILPVQDNTGAKKGQDRGQDSAKDHPKPTSALPVPKPGF